MALAGGPAHRGGAGEDPVAVTPVVKAEDHDRQAGAVDREAQSEVAEACECAHADPFDGTDTGVYIDIRIL